jgi:hypothetical protein
MGTDEFDDLLAEAHCALEGIAKADPAGYKALYPDADDVTLENPFGGSQRLSCVC